MKTEQREERAKVKKKMIKSTGGNPHLSYNQLTKLLERCRNGMNDYEYVNNT